MFCWSGCHPEAGCSGNRCCRHSLWCAGRRPGCPGSRPPEWSYPFRCRCRGSQMRSSGAGGWLPGWGWPSPACWKPPPARCCRTACWSRPTNRSRWTSCRTTSCRRTDGHPSCCPTSWRTRKKPHWPCRQKPRWPRCGILWIPCRPTNPARRWHVRPHRRCAGWMPAHAAKPAPAHWCWAERPGTVHPGKSVPVSEAVRWGWASSSGPIPQGWSGIRGKSGGSGRELPPPVRRSRPSGCGSGESRCSPARPPGLPRRRAGTVASRQ